MDELILSDIERIVFGFYLIFHGLIFIVFFFYYDDPDSGIKTGWSRKSWLLDRYLDQKNIRLTGFVFWSITILSFILSGILVFDIIEVFNLNAIPFIIFSSVISSFTYIGFFDGLKPTPYHWILGLLINIVLVIYLFLSIDVTILLITLGVITVYGMLFHIRIVTSFS